MFHRIDLSSTDFSLLIVYLCQKLFSVLNVLLLFISMYFSRTSVADLRTTTQRVAWAKPFFFEWSLSKDSYVSTFTPWTCSY